MVRPEMKEEGGKKKTGAIAPHSGVISIFYRIMGRRKGGGNFLCPILDFRCWESPCKCRKERKKGKGNKDRAKKLTSIWQRNAIGKKEVRKK